MSEPSISLAVIQGKQVLTSASSIANEPERVQAIGPLPRAPSLEAVHDDHGDEVAYVAPDSLTADSTPNLSGRSVANGQVEISAAGFSLREGPVDAKGQWTFTPTTALADGYAPFTVTTTDDVGNVGPARVAGSVHIAASLPVAVITSIDDDAGTSTGSSASGARTDDTTPTVSGTATQSALVTVYDNGVVIGSVHADHFGHWNFTAPGRMDGAHSLTVTATNDVGTTGAVSTAWTIDIDPSLPVAAITLPEDDDIDAIGSAGTAWAVEIDTDLPGIPVIVSVIDDVGGVTGNVPRSAITDNTEPSTGAIADLNGAGEHLAPLSLADILAQGESDLFFGSEHDARQVLVKGEAGDRVELSGLLGDSDVSSGEWAVQGDVTVAGVVYTVYQHSSLQGELLVQEGLITQLV